MIIIWYDEVLYKIFTLIIKHGSHDLSMLMEQNDTITASNYLKKDKNFVDIIRMNWDDIAEGIKGIFESI